MKLNPAMMGNFSLLKAKCGPYCIPHLVVVKSIHLEISTFHLEGAERGTRSTVMGSAM